MNDASSRIPIFVVALLAAASLGLFAWMLLGFVLPFCDLAKTSMLEVRMGPYGAADIGAMRDLLGKNQPALDLLNAMHHGPDLFFPAIFTAFLYTALLKLRPAGHYFNRPLSPAVIAAIYALPFVYGLSDYVENILTTNIFGGGVEWGFAATVLPWFSTIKFLAAAICLIVILRFALYRIVPPADRDTP